MDEKNSYRKNTKNKNKFIRILILTIFVVGISIGLSMIILKGARDLLGLKTQSIQVEVTIPKGATTKNISSILKEKKIIDSPLIFRVYSKIKKADGKYQNGKHLLNSRMPYGEIINTLQTSTNRTDVVSITIPEGYTINQISNILAENKVCSKEDFLQAIEKGNFSSKALNKIPKNKLKRYWAEGVLFPDTYEFVINDNPDNIIRTMLNNFDKKILEDLENYLSKSDLALSEIITLASIVQKECPTIDIMKKAASVFLNRLHNPDKYTKLQACSTIFYVENDIKPSLQFKNQEMYDKYNTYKCIGLPVGPICNPGIDSIKSILDPEITDYFYFLTDANGEYHWSKTLDEHNINLYKARKIGNIKGINTNN